MDKVNNGNSKISEENKKTLLLKSILKQLSSGTPFFRCHLPICFSDSKSLLEKLSEFFFPSKMILNISEINDCEERFLSICSFFISIWNNGPQELKAPFNPILGEVFHCKFNSGDTTSIFVSEQISHHPPSTAFCVYNEAKRLYLTAYVKPTIKFCGNSVETYLNGTLFGAILDHDEVYELTYPKYITKGVLFGTLKLELGGKTYVRCKKNDLLAEIDFKSKRAILGKVHKLNQNGDPIKTLYTLEGYWDQKIHCINHKTKKEYVLLDTSNVSNAEQEVAPLEQQKSNESRRVWQSVIENIIHNEEDKAFAAKFAIEEEQRNLKNEKKASDFEPKLFEKIGDVYVYSQLKNIFGSDIPILLTPTDEKLKKKKNRDTNENGTDKKKPQTNKTNTQNYGKGEPNVHYN